MMKKNGIKPRPLTTAFSYQQSQMKPFAPVLGKNGASELFRWGFTLFVAVWMFVLGIIVGRVTTPTDFDINAIEKELARLRDAEMEKDREEISMGLATLNDTQLDFYDELRGTSRRPATVPQPSESAPVPEIKRAVPKTTVPEPEKKEEKPRVESSYSADLPLPVPQPGNVEMTVAIQVASFAARSDADRTVSLLKEKGYSGIFVSHEDVPDVGPRYRIKMGYFKNRKEAGMVVERLKKREFFKDAYIFNRK
ncbi:MAG: SPOR domain-containing protein [Desulfococcaceae bacterium]